jgi:hypothetical protein
LAITETELKLIASAQSLAKVKTEKGYKTPAVLIRVYVKEGKK